MKFNPIDFRSILFPTAEETLISKYRSGDPINIEIDVLARYVKLIMAQSNPREGHMDLLEKIGSIS